MKKLFLSLLLFIFFESVLAQTKDLAYYEKELTTYMKKKDPYGAMEFLTQGIEEAPDSAFLYYMRGVLLDAFQNYDAAIQDFDLGYKKAQSDKEKSSFLTSLGGLKAKVRKFEEAEKYLLLALEYDSLNLATLNNLSTILDDLEKM
ncbi:MAG: hypothetical protein OEY34_10660, partial [Cyclobacteriaceae bacterium]|nr:hypothetical protein [Cyclobacteriaceae bacterium]